MESVSLADRMLLAPLDFAAHSVVKRIERKARDWSMPGTTEIWLVKGYCIPARGLILTALEPFGVKVLDLDECLMPNEQTPFYIDAWVRVKDEQAEWAEYLLMRSRKFQVTSPALNRRNAEWARQHNGEMPTPWASREPWVESGCTAKGAAEYQKKQKAKVAPKAEDEPVQRSRYARERTRPARAKRTGR